MRKRKEERLDISHLVQNPFIILNGWTALAVLLTVLILALALLGHCTENRP